MSRASAALSLDGPAATAIVRTIASVFAGATVLLGLLAAQAILPQLAATATWWDVPAVILVFGPPIAMAAVAWWVRARTLRIIAGVLGVAYPILMVTLKLALPTGQLDPSLQSPWILQLTALGTSAAAIAWPRWGTAFYVVAISVLLVPVRVAVYPGQILDIASQDALNGLLYDGVFAALAVAAIRAGAMVDGAASAARIEAEAVAAQLAQGRERARAEALIHDRVLAILLAAGRPEVHSTGSLAAQAENTLQELEQFREGPREQAPLKPAEFVWMQQALTTDIAPEAQFSYEVLADAEIPGPVVQAFAEAASEALRNSCRHAGEDARAVARAVHVRLSTDTLTVTILDDGKGFDPKQVAPTRLGLAVGVFGRMGHLDGGAARIVSAPGRGTTVVLEWTRA